MNKISWSPGFKRTYKQYLLKQPHFQTKFSSVIRMLETDIWNPSIKTHKLHGNLEGLYSCSIDYYTRLVFDIIEMNSIESIILLIDIGSHDSVY
jgi:mRNA interferase YafQ